MCALLSEQSPSSLHQKPALAKELTTSKSLPILCFLLFALNPFGILTSFQIRSVLITYNMKRRRKQWHWVSIEYFFRHVEDWVGVETAEFPN